MKKHFITLFDRKHRWFTAGFFVAGALFIAAESTLTFSDWLLNEVLLYAGVAFLFLAFIHPWRNAISYFVLSFTCATLIALIFITVSVVASIRLDPGEVNHPSRTEEVIEAILFVTILYVCVTGIAIGIAGGIWRTVAEVCRKRKEHKTISDHGPSSNA